MDTDHGCHPGLRLSRELDEEIRFTAETSFSRTSIRVWTVVRWARESISRIFPLADQVECFTARLRRSAGESHADGGSWGIRSGHRGE